MRSASACSLLFLLSLLLCSNGDMILDPPDNVLRLPSMDHDHHHHHHHHHPVTDPSLKVFFTLNDLKPGKRMEIYFSKKAPASTPKFLPRPESESIPFSLEHLPHLLRFFSFSPESPQAKAMEDTLTQCHVIKPIKGETKFCATSVDSMLDFARAILGPRFRILNTRFVKDSGTLFQNYTVSADPLRVPAPKMVACHTMPYPYGVYYCHSQMSENRAFRVSLVGDNGDDVDAVAVCHMDTSQWSPTHASFSVLGEEPGSSHVCHFFPEDNLVIVPN